MPIDYREIARLKRKEVSNRKIASLLVLSRNTVNKTVALMSASQRSWLEIEQMDDETLNKMMNKSEMINSTASFVVPDYEKLGKELARPGVTMQLLWEEYMDECRLSKKQGYKITQFKKYFNDYLSKSDFSQVIRHKAGERMEVDWAGTKPCWIDPDTGERVDGYLFVSSCSFSGYSFAWVYPNMKSSSWIDAHVRMYDYYGGVSRILIPDNLKVGVTKNSKEEVVLNRLYSDLADHYGTTIIPTRVRKPKDKATVENVVGKLTTHIIARMRDYQFFSIDEYNHQLLIELDKFNRKPFQKKEGSRFQMFIEIEKPQLLPLPKHSYQLAIWKKAKVQKNSHVCYQKRFYSVPHSLIGQEVQLKIYNDFMEIFFNSVYVHRHPLLTYENELYCTDPTHLPKDRTLYNDWTAERFIRVAKSKGRFVHQVVLKILTQGKAEQKYFKDCYNLLKLADIYSDQRLDIACQLALDLFARPSYKNIKTILSNNQDRKSISTHQSESKGRFVRGGDYYDK